ncbi:MAG TPA: YccF domain-containing protein [Phenylobacterium sp.]|nr:YccF domain-containing protein [Phenylobacterium sp.]
MRLLLNLLWFVLGGWVSLLLWLLSGVLLAITVVCLPWSMAAFRIAGFSAWPFGRQVVSKPDGELGTGPFGFLLNVIWFLLGGWYLAASHLVMGVGLMLTIIGIPFGLQHIKLAVICLAPVGKQVVDI